MVRRALLVVCAVLALFGVVGTQIVRAAPTAADVLDAAQGFANEQPSSRFTGKLRMSMRDPEADDDSDLGSRIRSCRTQAVADPFMAASWPGPSRRADLLPNHLRHLEERERREAAELPRNFHVDHVSEVGGLDDGQVAGRGAVAQDAERLVDGDAPDFVWRRRD